MKKQQHEAEEAERRLRYLGQRLRSVLRSGSDDKKIKEALRAQYEEETEGGTVKASKRRPEDR